MTSRDFYSENFNLRRELRAAKVWIWTFAISTLFLSSYILYDFARQCYPEAF